MAATLRRVTDARITDTAVRATMRRRYRWSPPFWLTWLGWAAGTGAVIVAVWVIMASLRAMGL